MFGVRLLGRGDRPRGRSPLAPEQEGPNTEPEQNMNEHGHAQQSLNLNQLSLPFEESCKPHQFGPVATTWIEDKLAEPGRSWFFRDVQLYGQSVRLLVYPKCEYLSGRLCAWYCKTSNPKSKRLSGHGTEPTLQDAKDRLDAWAAGI